MPHSTYLYSFEWKIFTWAGYFSEQLTGAQRGFVLLFDAEGVVRQMHTTEGAGGSGVQRREELLNGWDSRVRLSGVGKSTGRHAGAAAGRTI